MKNGFVIRQINVKPRVSGEHGLPKTPVAEVEITEKGLVGDYNHYRTWRLLGTKDQAVLLVPMETLMELQQEGWPVQPGDLGENITTEGCLYAQFQAGDIYQAGPLRFQLTLQAEPCNNLAQLSYVGDSRKKEFIQVLRSRRGWYAKVLCPGRIKVGEKAIRLE